MPQKRNRKRAISRSVPEAAATAKTPGGLLLPSDKPAPTGAQAPTGGQAPTAQLARKRRIAAGWGVFLLAAACASVNVTKAVHVDDTAYLEIARGIRADPLHPMRHAFLWQENTPAPAFKTNQPHLLFYIQALVMAVFGESELAQHLLMALMVWGALWAFYLLAALLVPEAPLFLTALFALGPSLLPGQNLMTDVPQTGLWALFYWAVLTAGDGRERKRYLLAAVCIAAASLIKYTSLVLLIVLPVVQVVDSPPF